MSPRFVWSMAEGYPPVLKQFLQFCLVLIYPAWVVGVPAAALVYGVVYSVLWVVLWPVRAWMKRNRPEEYAASQLKWWDFSAAGRPSRSTFPGGGGTTPDRDCRGIAGPTDRQGHQRDAGMGYTNFYRYHWAGRADSAMAAAGEALWMSGDVGTNAGATVTPMSG